MLRVFTAFSGYDSQCLALNVLMWDCANKIEAAGLKGVDIQPFVYDLVGWSEIDKYAIKAHNALFPQWSERNYGDISKIDWSQVPDFDLFTYSSPCQDFSSAGKQAGGTKGSGTRSSLLWECERAIRAKKPKYLLMENVAALVSSKFVKLFNEWQLTLERLGYTNFAQVLNAKTHGYPTPVPQNRERIFMVSILNCEQPFFFPDPQKLTTRLSDVLESDVDEKYYLKDAKIESLLAESAKQEQRGNGFTFAPKTGEDIGNTVQTTAGNRKTDNFVKVAGVLSGEKWDKRYKSSNRVYDGDGVSPTLHTCGGGGTEPKLFEPVVAAMRGRGEDNEQQLEQREDGCTNTITSVQKDNLLVLGWSRDKKGKIKDRHPVKVANTVTAGKRDNTQNYVIEK